MKIVLQLNGGIGKSIAVGVLHFVYIICESGLKQLQIYFFK